MEEKSMYVMIDNFDSFVYNLKAYFQELGREILVRRCDEITLEELEELNPEGIILSPGPKRPWDAKFCVDTVKRFQGRIPVLGVCLGHQAIGEAFGARLENLKEVYHGVQTSVSILRQDVLFEGLGKEIPVGRYHSWVVSREDFPDCLEITAESWEGQIMALRHRTYDVHGIQFHPESVLTPQGKEIIKNFLND